jgi:hypothetical protein
MSASHLQVNHDASIIDAKTNIIPSTASYKKDFIISILALCHWEVDKIEHVGGSHFKVETHCQKDCYRLNVFLSSVRDEDRANDEFKMQIGTSYIPKDEDGWENIILGAYIKESNDRVSDSLLVAYDYRNYSFDTNPSLRGARTSYLQKAKIIGYYQTPNCCIFRPEFFIYYIKQLLAKHDNTPSEINNLEQNTPEDMKNYIEALKTKPFLLLAGISGTGKSQKVKELAYMTCPADKLGSSETTPGNYCLIEVKPNWHDSSELLGYYSNLTGMYHVTDFLRFAYKAAQNPDYPFFVCLDEMNLAPVEQYFAEYLSVLETRTVVGDHIESAKLLTKESFEGYTLSDEYAPLDKEVVVYIQENGLSLPENLFIIGTVNMDDTTHQFSRKVIDRAFTIEMNGGELTAMFSDENTNALKYRKEPVSLEVFKPKYVKAAEALEDSVVGNYAEKIKKDVPAILTKVNEILKDTPFRVSYRVQNELILYVANMILTSTESSIDIDTVIKEAALVILLEKILPRVQGDDKLLSDINGSVFAKLKGFLDSDFTGLEETAVYGEVVSKLEEMDKRLTNTYFANFF